MHVPAELPDAAEFTCNATLIPESGLLEAAESSTASWSGVYLHDRTNPAGPLADKLLCNGMHDLAPASMIQGNLSVVLMPAEGSNNASATIATLDEGGSLIRLSSLWIVSLKVQCHRKSFPGDVLSLHAEHSTKSDKLPVSHSVTPEKRGLNSARVNRGTPITM